MARRNPARYLAPLALVATAVALFVIVTSTPDDEREATPNRTSESSRTSGEGGDGGEERETPGRKGPRRYTVKEGDTPSAIAERTGVPLETILELNPDLDPQTLSPGQRIRLRESGQ